MIKGGVLVSHRLYYYLFVNRVPPAVFLFGGNFRQVTHLAGFEPVRFVFGVD